MIFEKTVHLIDKLQGGKPSHEVIDELRNAELVVRAAIAVVKNPAYAGICDEDVELEKTLRQGGFI